MVWLVQNYRSIKCLQFLKLPELRRGGLIPPGPPTRALPTTRWGTLSGPQTPRLLTPPPPPNHKSWIRPCPLCYFANVEICHGEFRFY